MSTIIIINKIRDGYIMEDNMNINLGNNRHIKVLKERIFKSVLLLSCVVFFIVSFINLMNFRPWINFILPIVASGVLLLMFRLYSKKRNTIIIKNSYMIFLCIIYFPLGWLTSPGSYSAMSFYSVLIFFVSIILAHDIYEYLYPVLMIIETIILLNYEPLRPEQFTLYTSPSARAIDLSINYLITAAVIFSIVIIINSYFDLEHKKVYDASITDQLTGLYNRRYLYHVLEDLMLDDNDDAVFTLLMMDLNNFKKVNDIYGHIDGDEVLQKFGGVLKDASRKRDVPIRYGGDEFVLILPGTSIRDAENVKTRIVDMFEKISSKYQGIELSVSFGITENTGQGLERLIKEADDLLYKNKEDFKKNNG